MISEIMDYPGDYLPLIILLALAIILGVTQIVLLIIQMRHNTKDRTDNTVNTAVTHNINRQAVIHTTLFR